MVKMDKKALTHSHLGHDIGGNTQTTQTCDGITSIPTPLYLEVLGTYLSGGDNGGGGSSGN